jgi:hypothetical protein
MPQGPALHGGKNLDSINLPCQNGCMQRSSSLCDECRMYAAVLVLLHVKEEVWEKNTEGPNMCRLNQEV